MYTRILNIRVSSLLTGKRENHRTDAVDRTPIADPLHFVLTIDSNRRPFRFSPSGRLVRFVDSFRSAALTQPFPPDIEQSRSGFPPRTLHPGVSGVLNGHTEDLFRAHTHTYTHTRPSPPLLHNPDKTYATGVKRGMQENLSNRRYRAIKSPI